jgi:hypothetical protein
MYMPTFLERVKRAYNVLTEKDEAFGLSEDHIASSVFFGGSSHSQPRDSKDILLAPILNRIATDAANVPIRHIMTDERGAYLETRQSELNDRLNGLANIDQTGTVMIQEGVTTMLNNGVCAFVPVVTTKKPTDTEAYEILSMRVGSIVEWRNRSVVVSVYNEDRGDVEDVPLSKTFVAIVYNPFYSIMNRPNSTLQRLINKLALLDKMDKDATSSQLDLILQLPYQVKSEKRITEAQKRLARLEEQLSQSKYGVAYVDATEKITQLNRPVKYSLTDQIQYLYDSLNSQLGLTPAVFSGTASELELVTYYNRTVLPILTAITESMKHKFLTKTARTQGQSIAAHQSLFKMAPILQIAEAADKLTRNEILSPNEIRAALGWPKSNQKESDELRNRNISQPAEEREASKQLDNNEEVQ